MKIFFTLALHCLCFMSVYAQDHLGVEQKPTAVDGIYLLEKAELFINNYKTKKLVEHKIITDAASIDLYNIHVNNIFLETTLLDGNLIEFVLPDKQRYKLDEMMRLQPAMDDKLITQMGEDEITNNYFFFGKGLQPYDFRIEGEKMIVTFVKYNFGQSNVKYTMVAELVITLTKQKDR